MGLVGSLTVVVEEEEEEAVVVVVVGKVVIEDVVYHSNGVNEGGPQKATFPVVTASTKNQH